MQTPEQKAKARWRRIFRVYGVTQDEYSKLDRGFCPICLREWSDRIKPCVDHDHVTGFVRGILCSYCNRYVLGRLRDPAIARRLLDYLSEQPLTHRVPKAPKKKRRKKNK